MNKRAEYLINTLKLTRHPEGGYFREIYRSGMKIDPFGPGMNIPSSRNLTTSILFLLESNDFSSFHKLKSDELWHFYEGTPVRIITIDKKGKLSERLLGLDLENAMYPVVVISSDTWFAAEVIDKNSFTLIGCTVSPGFEFDDFQLGKRSKLTNTFPEYTEVIKRFTRDL